MKRIAVTASTMLELALLVERTGALPFPGTALPDLFRADLAGTELLIATTGIGKVNAACCATLLLERFAPELLVNTGCGGAFPEAGLFVGDLAVAKSECLADEGVLTPAGWHGLELIGIPVFQEQGERYFNTIPLDEALSRRAAEAAKATGFPVALGPFLTVSTCSGTSARGRELLRHFPGICENMEGGAVAQAALRFRTPVLEVRGISNMVEDRDMSRWDLKGAVARAQTFLLGFLESLPAAP